MEALNIELDTVQKEKNDTVSGLREKIVALENILKEEREVKKQKEEVSISELKEELAIKNHSLEDSRMKITELEQNLSSKSTIMEEKSSELAELNITLKEKEHKLSELEKNEGVTEGDISSKCRKQ